MAYQKQRKTLYGVETFHENPDRPGEYVIQKTFDRDPIIERAKLLREMDEYAVKGAPRFAMSIPVTMFFEWMKSGKLQPEDYVEMEGGGICIDPKKLAELQKEYSKLAGH